LDRPGLRSGGGTTTSGSIEGAFLDRPRPLCVDGGASTTASTSRALLDRLGLRSGGGTTMSGSVVGVFLGRPRPLCVDGGASTTGSSAWTFLDRLGVRLGDATKSGSIGGALLFGVGGCGATATSSTEESFGLFLDPFGRPRPFLLFPVL
jgi:hypothetical protein